MNAILIIVFFIFISIIAEIMLRRRLSRYWLRSCTGKDWKRRFPKVPKQEIREFLELFVDGFAFNSKKCLKFNPNDKVIDVYRVLYPTLGWPDSLELETFAINLEKKYGFKLETVFNNDITLGKIFEMVKKINPNQ